MYEQNNLRVWGRDIEPDTLRQAEKTARLPILAGPLALMPDAHVGLGSTVGSVIATSGSILPAAVGVDLGCGMIASQTDLVASQLPDNLDKLLAEIERSVPAGVGKAHGHVSKGAESFLRSNPAPTPLKDLEKLALSQFGTLGSGNHFFEVSLDENDSVWLVIHSGSRGIGNKLASRHISTAKQLAKDLELRLEDPELAYFVEGTPEFKAYIADMLWSQHYALGNRAEMMSAATNQFFRFVGHGREIDRIQSHHNFAQKELHNGVPMWITRKGAVKADKGDRGVLPGSMGTSTYVVRGRGNPLSYNSSPHGAGRRMSRGEAKRAYTIEDLEREMKGKTWLVDKAQSLLDEIPSSYKDVERVLEDSLDLVEVEHTLHQILNFKGA